MKLLFCDECWDIFKLAYTVRSCRCGKCRGKYNADGGTAVTNGKGMCLALSNPSLMAAYQALFVRGETKPSVECWARPHTGKDNPRTTVQKEV